MKTYIPYSLLAALAATGMAVGAETAYTTPVGYTTQSLLANRFNLIGLDVQTPIAVAGKLETVAGAVLTDTDVADFTTVLPAGGSNTYVIEITSGAAAGTSQEFVTRSGSTVTLPGAVAGLAANDTYQIRIAPTLEAVFGTTTSILTKGATAAQADIVSLPNGSGGYNQYWMNLGSTIRNFIGGAAAPNVAVIYMDGMLVQKRAVASSLVASGEVKKVGTTTTIVKGFNPVAATFPVGSTLQNIGLDDDLTKGATAAQADIVHIPNGAGGYTLYWLNLGTSWRNFVGGAAAAANVPLTPGFFIEKKNVGTVAVDLTPPASYSTL